MSAANGVAGYPPLDGVTRVVATVSIAGVNFMTTLDMTVANVSISAIAGDLGASPAQGTWVITSFNIANAIIVPLSGWLAQRFGSVRTFLLATLLFTLASLFCGLSSSLPMLIAFRVVQGIAAGPLIPLAQSLLLQCYPKAKAGSAIAAWGITTMAAPALGPILGGYITDNISWPWIFYINVPVGLIAAWVNWSLLRERESDRISSPIDYVGLALLVVWVGAMQLVLDRGRELDWFNSAEISALSVIALVGFCFFIAWELFDEHPVVAIRFFLRRNFMIGTLSSSLGMSAYISGVVLLPLWLQQTLGYSATQAGLMNSPASWVAILMAPLIGRHVHKYDPRLLVTYAFSMFAVACYLRSGFIVDLTVSDIVVPQLITGLGISAFFIPLTTLIFSGLAADEIAAASGLSNFVRMMSGAMMTSLTITFWENRTSLHHARLTEALTDYSTHTVHTLEQLAAVGLDRMRGLATIEHQINVQAQTMSVDEFYWLCGIGYLCLIVLVWLARPAPVAQKTGPAPVMVVE